MLGLYKLHGRTYYGTLYGLFIEDTEKVEKLIDEKIEVNFGEVLGKHSEVVSNLDKSDIELVTTDEAVIKTVQDNNLCFGYNPFNYLERE